MAVIFPVYLLGNIATIFKIKHDTSIEATDKEMLSVMQRVVVISLGILFSQFLVDFDKAEAFLKSHLIKNQQKQLKSVFTNHMDGIVLSHRRKDEDYSDNELHPDTELSESKQTRGELVIDLCNQAVTKIFGFTP